MTEAIRPPSRAPNRLGSFATFAVPNPAAAAPSGTISASDRLAWQA